MIIKGRTRLDRRPAVLQTALHALGARMVVRDLSRLSVAYPVTAMRLPPSALEHLDTIVGRVVARHRAVFLVEQFLRLLAAGSNRSE